MPAATGEGSNKRLPIALSNIGKLNGRIFTLKSPDELSDAALYSYLDERWDDLAAEDIGHSYETIRGIGNFSRHLRVHLDHRMKEDKQPS
ncbi:hypothetical protein NOR_08297 [Metarhizium rileyi]|uniref:Uncharacterized protein n=1 Tax=Metarhizium rileyi (strain RCEF 4871) TaxID=1649241 RepID=A0A166RXF3_METRR|nr:hypothetical protein NOR_08297 [Metarhizium rileyi RCEF 4871]